MPDRDDVSPLPPPRFSLRTLLIAVSVVAVFFGSFWWFSPLTVAALTLAALIVASHVFGNALGTQLRDRAPRRTTESCEAIDRQGPPANPQPVTHLGERRSLGWGMILPTLGGVIAGGLGGCLLMQSVYHMGFDLRVLAVAGVSFGALGGFAAFCVASFSQVLVVALWQAMEQESQGSEVSGQKSEPVDL